MQIKIPSVGFLGLVEIETYPRSLLDERKDSFEFALDELFRRLFLQQHTYCKTSNTFVPSTCFIEPELFHDV